MAGITTSANDNDAKKAVKASPEAETVIAATAGRDNWQTWAGRKHGTGDFEMLDVFRGLKRSIHHSFQTNLPKEGTPCPVCFCEPEDGESPSEFWHVTWCGHAVCKECLGQYAINSVRDREQSGPLKCPVCLKTLRKNDAVVAMMAGKQQSGNGGCDDDEDLIKEWDRKMRDQLLRAIPSFRSCPKCGGGNNNKNSSNSHSNGVGGGGFVTPECLGPKHQERRDEAIKILLLRNYAYAGIVVFYLVLVVIIAYTPTPSPVLDLWSMLLPLWVVAKLGMATNHGLATRARAALFRSIEVGCPCCAQTFVLPAESKVLSDEETSRWVTANTRPCPSCSVPISKTGGCNHMRCSHCGVQFCWACMRLRTACQAYRCQNGAPYQNASIFDGNQEQQAVGRRQALQRDGSVLTYIDHILNHRTCPALTVYGDGLIVLVAMVGRFAPPVQYVAIEIISPFFVQVIKMMNTPYYLAGLLMVQFYATEYLQRQEQDAQLQHEQQQLLYDNHHVLVISIISLFSFPIGVSIYLFYCVVVILPRVREQQHQQEQQGQGEQPLPVRREVEQQIAAAVPENPIIERLNETMLNAALQRSIEET